MYRILFNVAVNFLKLLEDLNHAIDDALSIKRLSLLLEGIKEAVGVLAEKASLETADVNSDIGKMGRLQGRAEQLHIEIKELYGHATKILEDTEALMGAQSWIPFHRKKFLQNKQFVLINELNAVSTFYRNSERDVERIKKSMPPRFGLMSSSTTDYRL